MIQQMTLFERLWAVQQTLQAFAFNSVAHVLLAELAAGGRSAVGVGKRTEQFFGGNQAIKVLNAITSHPKYHIRVAERMENEDHIAWVQGLIAPLVQAEMEKLISDEDLCRPFLDFWPQVFEDVEIFARIHERQHTDAPILSTIFRLAGGVECKQDVNVDSESQARILSESTDIRDPGVQQPRTKVPRNRLLIVSISLQLRAYA